MGVRAAAHQDALEMLRVARGTRLGQASDKEYRRAVEQAERQLGIR